MEHMIFLSRIYYYCQYRWFWWHLHVLLDLSLLMIHIIFYILEWGLFTTSNFVAFLCLSISLYWHCVVTMLLFHIFQDLGYFQHHWYYCSLWRMGASFVKPSGPSTCFWGYVSSLLKFFHPGDLLYFSSLWFSRVLSVKQRE